MGYCYYKEVPEANYLNKCPFCNKESKIKQDCLKVPQNNTGEYIDKMIKTMRTEAKAYFIEGIDENRKNGVEISELDNIIYKKLIDERRTEHTLSLIHI